VVYDDGEDLAITVSATYEGPLEKLDYEAVVLRPDGSDPVPIELSPVRDEPGTARGVFPASEFHGRGQYLVVATCDASDAWFHPGESLDADDELLPAVRSPAFLRAGSNLVLRRNSRVRLAAAGRRLRRKRYPRRVRGSLVRRGVGRVRGQRCSLQQLQQPEELRPAARVFLVLCRVVLLPG
jgi:hypothetical protein